MAISFVGSHVGTHDQTSAQTVNFSSLLDAAGGTPTVLAGDVVYVGLEVAGAADRTQAQMTPSGYTTIHTDDYRNDSNDSNFQVSRKTMGGVPDTSVAIPAVAAGQGAGYAIMVLRGVDTTTPEDATPVVTGAIDTGKANAAAITPVTAGAWVLVFCGAAVAAGAVFAQNATPDLSTTTNHFRTATITTTSWDPVIGVGIKTDWTSGAFDPAIWTGSTATATGSWSAVTVAVRPAATLAPALFTNSQTFYAPTITTGPVDLAPSLVTNTQTFYAPTAVSVYPLTPSLLTNDQTFYGPTIAVGAVDLAPSLFTNSQVFYAPTVTPGAVDLTPSLFTNAQAFYAPTATASYTLAPDLFTNGQTFYDPAAAATYSLTAPLLTNTQTFYGPTISASYALTASTLTNTQTFYAATVVRLPRALTRGEILLGRRRRRKTIDYGAPIMNRIGR